MIHRKVKRPPLKHVVLAVFLALTAGLALWISARSMVMQQPDPHLRRGMEALNRGNATEAEEELRAAVRAAPGSVKAMQGLGTLLISQGRLQEARNVLNRAADSGPRSPHLLCELAEAELRGTSLQQLDAAAADGARAANLEPDCARANAVAGRALIAKGDTRRGIDYLSRAARLRPGDVSLALELHQNLLGTQRLDEATQVALELTRRYPRQAHGYALLGLCYQLHPPESPQGRAAVETLQRAFQLDRRNVVALAQLGHHYLSNGDAPRALHYLEAARTEAPDRPSVLFDLSRAYRMAGRGPEAEQALKAFRTVSDLNAEISTLQKRLLLEPGRPELTQRLARLQAHAASLRPRRKVRQTVTPAVTGGAASLR